MREILFRGKRLDNGEWVEGGIIPLDAESGYVFIVEPLYDIIKHRTHLVDTETVGQYTGLKDDNGTRVYEGDVIERRSSRRNYRDAVVAEEWNCGCCSDVYGFSTYEGVVSLRDNFVVIGNIHDNPELLKRGGEE